MAYDLEEQEQIDELKSWWVQNKRIVITSVIVILSAYIGWHVYQNWLNTKSEQASTAYQTLVSMSTVNLDDKSLSQIVKQADAIRTTFDITPYAGRAGLFEARILHENSKKVEAKKILEWVAANAKEVEVSDMARIEIAGLEIESNTPDNAEKTLKTIKSKGFDGIKFSLLGDIYANKQLPKAKEAYTKAVAALNPEGKLYYLTKQKLDALKN